MFSQVDTILLLSISYVLIAVVVIALWFTNVLGVKVKLLVSIFLPALYLMHWIGLKQSEGWPSDQELPKQFELIKADIIEPNETRKIKGSINLWVRIDGDQPPRAYVLAYSRALHENIAGARKRAAGGRRQIGSMSDGNSSSGGVNVSKNKKIDFQDAPPLSLPAKF